MPSYDNFAVCYDRFTTDVEYSRRVDRILSLFDEFDRRPRLMLDLACGTGGFSFELAKRGIDVIGVDCSEGMLSVAASKQGPDSTNPMFLCQYAEELELYGTVDGAVCMLDSLNHITEYADFCKALEKVALFLEKDRLFVFDLNTNHKHKNVLGNNIFVREDEDAFCVWQNYYDGESTVDIDLDVFLQNQDGTYKRFFESFSEVAYTDKQLADALASAGLRMVAAFDDISEAPPCDTTERITYIVRKI